MNYEYKEYYDILERNLRLGTNYKRNKVAVVLNDMSKSKVTDVRKFAFDAIDKMKLIDEPYDFRSGLIKDTVADQQLHDLSIEIMEFLTNQL